MKHWWDKTDFKIVRTFQNMLLMTKNQSPMNGCQIKCLYVSEPKLSIKTVWLQNHLKALILFKNLFYWKVRKNTEIFWIIICGSICKIILDWCWVGLEWHTMYISLEESVSMAEDNSNWRSESFRYVSYYTNFGFSNIYFGSERK